MEKMKNAVYSQGYLDALRTLNSIALGSFVIEEGTNDATIKTTSGNGLTATPYMIDGCYYTKATTDNVTATACAEQAVNTRCRYLISIDKAGTITTTKGTEVTSVTTGAITTVSVNAPLRRYTSTAASFTSFAKKNYVNITGFTYDGNNGVFRIGAVDPSGYWFEVEEGRQVTEAAGDSVTIVRESPLPDLPLANCPCAILIITTGTTTFTVGTDDITDDIGTGSSSFVQLASMPTGFIQ